MIFQKIVMTVAIVLLILVLIFIGVALYESKSKAAWPPVVSECPDYWEVQQVSGSNGENQCVNVKNLGKSGDDCRQPKDFSGSHWQGKQGLCRKYKWAKSCDLTWDGVTDNSDACKS